MKKIYALLLIAAMTVSLAACGKPADTATASSVQAESKTEESGDAHTEADAKTDYSAYYGMWYNYETSLGEIVIDEGELSYQGTVLRITDAAKQESENPETGNSETACILHTEGTEDNSIMQVEIFDPAEPDAGYSSLYLYSVDPEDPDRAIMLGHFVNDIHYSIGDLAETEITEDSEEASEVPTPSADGPMDPATTELYLIDHMEMQDGSTRPQEECTDYEYALAYDPHSPCMFGMMFTKNTPNIYRLQSENNVLKLEVEVPTDNGKTELMLLPVTFHAGDSTMTLDFSESGTKIKKMVFKQTDHDKFYSGSRESIAAMM